MVTEVSLDPSEGRVFLQTELHDMKAVRLLLHKTLGLTSFLVCTSVSQINRDFLCVLGGWQERFPA